MRGCLLAVAILAVVAHQPPLARGGDREIADAILGGVRSMKASAGLTDFSVGLHVEEGVVWLSGYVASQEQERAVLGLARKALGVQKVFNEIAIFESGRSREILPKSARDTGDTNQIGIEGEPNAVKPAGQSTDLSFSRATPASTTTPIAKLRLTVPQYGGVAASGSSPAQSERIVTEIIRSLRLEQQKGTLREFKIQVEARNGVVYLKGRMLNAAHHQLALEVARQVSGVTDVVSELEIDEPPRPVQITQQDKELANAIANNLRRLKQKGELRNVSVDVFVEDGVVWLSGHAPDSVQRKSILEAARYLPKVKVVVDDLVVEGQATVGSRDE